MALTKPVRRALATGAATAVLVMGAGPPSAPAARSAPAAPRPTPTCEEWQTSTLVPVDRAPTPRATTPRRGSRPRGIRTERPSSKKAARPPSRAVCRNAPPTPFTAPAWDPSSVVGGERLAGTGVLVNKTDRMPAPPTVLDVSYVIADLDSGEILAAKSPHAWLRPASTLKALTALTLIPRLDPQQVVTATADQVAANGTRAGMIAGNPYPVGSLFDAMLMLSANDAAYGLADAAGGYDRTLALMNATARKVGAYDTVVRDPSGLDEDGQHSSAYDLAVIGRAAMRLKAFRRYIVKTDAIFPGAKGATGKVYKPFHLSNINPLLRHYPGAIGIKPGRTNRAQHTFIGAATRGGRTLIVSQMGSTTGSWKPTAALLDWGFRNAGRVAPIGRLVTAGEATPPTVAPPPTIWETPAESAAPVGPVISARTGAAAGPVASARSGAPAGSVTSAGSASGAGIALPPDARDGDASGSALSRGTQPDTGTPVPVALRSGPEGVAALTASPVLVGGLAAVIGVLSAALLMRRRRRHH